VALSGPKAFVFYILGYKVFEIKFRKATPANSMILMDRDKKFNQIPACAHDNRPVEGVGSPKNYCDQEIHSRSGQAQFHTRRPVFSVPPW